MPAQKYHIKLTSEERKELENALRSNKCSMEGKKHAQILLAVDENTQARIPAISVIAAKTGVTSVTIWNVRKHYTEYGLNGLLGRKKREIPPVTSIITGEIEAFIIATCCSAPPEGKSRWTLKMLANQIVLSGLIDKISADTVRRV